MSIKKTKRARHSKAYIPCEYLADVALNSLSKTEIDENKFNAIITDEASNFKAARSLIIRRLQSQHVIEYRCLAHTFNLVGSAMSRAARVLPILDKAKQFASNIGRNILLCAKLKELGANRVKLIVPTRWYSTSICINSILEIKDMLGSVPKEEKYGWGKWKETFLSSSFWSGLVELKPFFDRISSFIGLVESRDSKLSDGFRAYLEFGQYLKEELPVEKVFRQEAFESYAIYFQRLNLPLLLAAYITDPNHKLQYLKSYAIDQGFAFLFGMILTHGYKAEVYNDVEAEFLLYQQKLKQDVPFISDTYSWWNEQNSFPYLKKISKRLACMHASSANTERIFSTLGRTLTNSRNRLDLGTVFDLLNCQLSGHPEKSKVRRTRTRTSTSSEMSVDEQEPNEEEDEREQCELDDQPCILDDSLPEEVESLREDDLNFFEKYVDFNSMPLIGLESPLRDSNSDENVDPFELASEMVRKRRS